MARPLRLEFPGSLWHITVRGNDRREIFADDRDRRTFLTLLGRCVSRFGWILSAYALMPNHFHLVVQLTKETLSRGMQWINASYTQGFNRRHGRVGHVFQGRFKGFLVERETYLLELLRYVVLNPVRAGLCAKPEEYKWSSYRSVIGVDPAPQWLAIDDALLPFGPHRLEAQRRYRLFVEEGIGARPDLWNDLKGQIYLGSDKWFERVQEQIALRPRADEHPRSQRNVGAWPMADIVAAVARVWSVDVDCLWRRGGGTPRMVAAWIGSREALMTNRTIAAGLRLRSEGHISALVQQCDQALYRSKSLQSSVDRCLATLRRKQRNSKT